MKFLLVLVPTLGWVANKEYVWFSEFRTSEASPHLDVAIKPKVNAIGKEPLTQLAELHHPVSFWVGWGIAVYLMSKSHSRCALLGWRQVVIPGSDG